MTIDATKPLATDLVSAIDDYIREDRDQINELWTAVVAANATETTHVMGLGEFALEIGTDLADVILEVISLTAAGAVNLIQITGGSGGMVKIIRAGDGNVTIKHNASYINLIDGIDLTLTAGDTISLINTGGDPATSVNGVWIEWTRTGAAVGEINTMSNAGTGAGQVYKQKTGVDFELRNIAAGSGIVVTNGASDITIASSGGGAGEITQTTINMGVGDTSLVTGVDLSNVINEIVVLTADAAVNLTTMLLALSGAIKTIVAADDDVTIIQDKASTTGGTFSLNSPAGVDLELQTGDVISFVNIGGDGLLAQGYWHEMYRTLRV
jgi:hypothetical protein